MTKLNSFKIKKSKFKIKFKIPKILMRKRY